MNQLYVRVKLDFLQKRVRKCREMTVANQKKVLIITFYAGANYGAFLQAYCLGKQMEKEGYSVFYLKDRFMEEDLKKYNNDYERDLHKCLREAIEEYLVVTDNNENYNLAILGSDEIWNRNSTLSFRKNMYWGINVNAEKIISYAPCSVGTSLKRMIFRGINLLKIDGISVRDNWTRNLVKSITRKQPPVVLDPTFLEDFSYINDNKYDFPYLFVYSYMLDDNQISHIKRIAKDKSLKTVVTGHQADWADVNIACTPFEWLSLIKFSSEVFTTTFHGSVFSLIFNKEFTLSGNNMKAILLLETFGFCSNSNDIISIRKDDYKQINKTICELKEQSIHFLKSYCE